MQLPLLTLPRAVPLVKDRPPQESVPQTKEQRELVRTLAQRYVAREKVVIPLSLAELQKHANKLVALANLDAKYTNYVGVVLNGEANREALASVPYDRRLLLLPKCLRVEDRCPAPFDEFGLLCKQCGLCTIQDLQNEAEKLGYAVLTAEGSALVMAIISTGKIDRAEPAGGTARGGGAGGVEGGPAGGVRQRPGEGHRRPRGGGAGEAGLHLQPAGGHPHVCPRRSAGPPAGGPLTWRSASPWRGSN